MSAHQPIDPARDKQPSAVTTNEQAYRDGTLSQPSAPTADVEKIAQEAAVKIAHGFLDGSQIAYVISQALVQARAPLVAALEDAIERFAGAPDNDEADEMAIASYRAALTGTEISRVKEGETTTTQKGDKQESDIIR